MHSVSPALRTVKSLHFPFFTKTPLAYKQALLATICASFFSFTSVSHAEQVIGIVEPMEAHSDVSISIAQVEFTETVSSAEVISKDESLNQINAASEPANEATVSASSDATNENVSSEQTNPSASETQSSETASTQAESKPKLGSESWAAKEEKLSKINSYSEPKQRSGVLTNGLNTTSGIIQWLLSTIAVLGCIFLLAYFLKKSRFVQRGTARSLNIETQIALGPKERVVKLELDGHRILVGVTPNQISFLADLDTLELHRDQAKLAKMQLQEYTELSEVKPSCEPQASDLAGIEADEDLLDESMLTEEELQELCKRQNALKKAQHELLAHKSSLAAKQAGLSLVASESATQEEPVANIERKAAATSESSESKRESDVDSKELEQIEGIQDSESSIDGVDSVVRGLDAIASEREIKSEQNDSASHTMSRKEKAKLRRLSKKARKALEQNDSHIVPSPYARPDNYVLSARASRAKHETEQAAQQGFDEFLLNAYDDARTNLEKTSNK